jgi:sec-independent protein translocase protein TatA
MGELGMGELLIILVLVILFFGTKKLPQLGEGLGKAIRNFKQAASGSDRKAERPQDPGARPGPPAGGS